MMKSGNQIVVRVYHILTMPSVKILSFPAVGWLAVLVFNDPLRQYFSLYRAVAQSQGEREKKG